MNGKHIQQTNNKPKLLLRITLAILCYGVTFTIGSVVKEDFSEGPQPLNSMGSLQERVARAGADEVRQIASVCIKKHEEVSETNDHYRSEIRRLRSASDKPSKHATLWYFNHPINHNIDTASISNSQEDHFSTEDEKPNDKAKHGHGTVRPRRSDGDRGDSIRSSGNDRGSGNRKQPKPRYSEEDEEDEDFVSNPGVVGSQNKPNRKDPSGNHRPTGKVIFEETFADRDWDSKWVHPKFAENGTRKYEKFFRVRSKPRQSGKSLDYGIMTSNKGSEDYAISTTFQPLNSNDGSLVIQFSLQYQTKPYCEKAFVRLFDCRFKPEDFSPDTPFLMQLGPNFCGAQLNQLSVEMLDPFKSERRVINHMISAVTSTDLHTYTLIIDNGGDYQILTNDTQVQNGTLKDSFPNYQGFPSICAVGLSVWHSVLDKFFKGQIILDDILISTDVEYAEKRRAEILDMPRNNSQN